MKERDRQQAQQQIPEMLQKVADAQALLKMREIQLANLERIAQCED